MDYEGEATDGTRQSVAENSMDCARPQNPNISRLQSSSSSSRSSSASTPSILSAHSSATQLTGSTGASTPDTPSYASRLSATESFPLFVTWNTLSRSGHKSLRGCIGTFEDLPLYHGLQSYAITSAFDDTRFSPIPASLMPSLSCSLTLLADFEPCDDPMEWDLGTHGIRISFTHRNRRHGATYLPDVAVEQGWTKEETLESLMKKAGWDGGYNRGVARRLLRGGSRESESAESRPWDEVADFKVVRYTGLKASGSYAEWQAFRAWVEEQGAAIQ
jgi:AMME syndrome candidate gene 1 protein